jgi:hypothetical protein
MTIYASLNRVPGRDYTQVIATQLSPADVADELERNSGVIEWIVMEKTDDRLWFTQSPNCPESLYRMIIIYLVQMKSKEK